MSLLSDRTNLTSTTQFKALGRALYRESGYISVYPVSRGTFSIRAGRGNGRRRQYRDWTGLDSLSALNDALTEAQDWALASIR